MESQNVANKPSRDLAPNDIVKSCKYLEMGSCFELDGIHSCVQGTIIPPLIVTAEEIRNNEVTHELVVERRRNLFAAINGLLDGPVGPCKTCSQLYEKRYKDVCFDFLGGEPLTAGMNIQYYTACNQRCTYCGYVQANQLVKPQYDMISYLELFRRKGKLRGNNWIDFSGGEPAMLKDFDRVLGYLLKHKLGTVVVYSNASIFSQSIYDALRKNKIILTTSLDTGIASTYGKLRGSNTFAKVLANLIRYRSSGTQRLWLKCVVCEANRTEDDLWSFVTAMLALRPDRLMISPEFPIGADLVPQETVRFVARLWHVLEKVTGLRPVEYTSDFGDPKWVRYHSDLAQALHELQDQNPYGDSLQMLALPSVLGGFRYRLNRMKYRLWGSPLRQRLLPKKSARERRMIYLWRRSFGRFLGD